jgi:hypothetical protein
LSTCDLYMGGYLKGKVYKSDYRTFKWSVEEHSKHCWDCQITVLHKVYLNMLTHAHQGVIYTSCLLKATCAYSHWFDFSLKMSQLCKSHWFVFCNMTNVYLFHSL